MPLQKQKQKETQLQSASSYQSFLRVNVQKPVTETELPCAKFAYNPFGSCLGPTLKWRYEVTLVSVISSPYLKPEACTIAQRITNKAGSAFSIWIFLLLPVLLASVQRRHVHAANDVESRRLTRPKTAADCARGGACNPPALPRGRRVSRSLKT